ncbi:MAG TPA: ribosome assembly cofactor RimP [Flavobacteriales bacterium]|nr:ribosome assembly cofactor RimP [Flavobacteriales bacterium]
MIKEKDIHKLIEAYLKEHHLFLVNLSVSKGNKISLYVDSMEGMSVEECIQLSRYIEQSLDRDAEDFELNVSTPGLSKPFLVNEQYKKYTGREIVVITTSGEKVSGVLKSYDDDRITVEVSEKKNGVILKEIPREQEKETKPKINFK